MDTSPFVAMRPRSRDVRNGILCSIYEEQLRETIHQGVSPYLDPAYLSSPITNHINDQRTLARESLGVTLPVSKGHTLMGEPPPISSYFFATFGVRRFAMNGPSTLQAKNQNMMVRITRES